jgi:hypothetical protein
VDLPSGVDKSKSKTVSAADGPKPPYNKSAFLFANPKCKTKFSDSQPFV